MKKQSAFLAGLFWVMLLAGAAGQGSGPGQAMPQLAGPPGAPNVMARADFGRVPLYFIPNAGQTDKTVAFYIQGRDKSVYFTPGGVTFSLRQAPSKPAGTRSIDPKAKAAVQDDTSAMSWVVKLDFVGANDKVKPVGEDKTSGVVSYFKGKPADRKAGLPTYSRIVYRNLWPGIDLAYSGTSNRLKYEFIVHPGADPAHIRLAYRGVDGISVDKDGRLEVKTRAGAFQDDAPVAYQEIDGAKKAISLGYKLDAQEPASKGQDGPRSARDAWAESRVYGFEVGAYDRARPLILDPSLVVFGGFIGGSLNDYGQGVAVDPQGNVYVAGYTNSTEVTFPETVGPDLTLNGNYDAFVAKVDASGAALLYCGYIGGSDDDRGYGIAVDASGNAYVTGYTLSTQTSFPVVAGYDLTHNGLKDAFIAKVNATGTALTYCTYIGGSGDDISNCIAVDGSGNAYIGGSTWSNETTFCEITGPDLTFNGGNYDAFVCKLNSTGTARYFCGYIGGDGDEVVNGIALDGSNNVYLAGNTGSREATFPVTVGPDLTTAEATNGFVAKLNASGIGFAYCGFLGSDSSDYAYAVAVDSSGSAFITGYVGEPGGLPVVVGPDLTQNGWFDAFVAKLKPDGTGYLYCGYLGGTGIERGYAISVDQAGNAYVAGDTEAYGSVPYPLVDAFDTTQAGNIEGFIAKISPSGAKLTYSSFIGGGGWDMCYGAAADARGNVYLTGYTTYGTDFPYAVGPDLTTNGNQDAFVAKVYHYFAPGPKTTAVGDFDGDGTKELAVDLGTNGAWLYDSDVWTQISAMNPEGMITANVDGNADDELLIEFGYAGLWLYDNGAMNLLSEEDVETMAAGDVDADGSDEVAVDFGATGFWLYDSGSWTQLSGANLDTMVIANLDGSGGAEIVGDFGAIGLWECSGGSWTQLSGVNVENMAAGNTDGTGGKELIGDFGYVGLWLLSAGSWTQLSSVNADYMITADLDHSGDDELIGDFSGIGLWVYDSGSWDILSGLDAEFEVAADTDGDGAKELAVDFGPLGIWLYNAGSWNQISGVDPENMIAGDIDGDNAAELFADFGALGLWLWNGGVWSQISANNPD